MKTKLNPDCKYLFTFLSKSKEGEYFLVKNAAAEKTWFKRKNSIRPENLFATPEAAYNCLKKRFGDCWFKELYENDAFFPVMFLYFDSDKTLVGPSCYGTETIKADTGKTIPEYMLFCGRLSNIDETEVKVF